MPYQSDNIEKLLINHKRRLQTLLERKAFFGSETPATIVMEIEDIEAEIKRLEAKLKELEQVSDPSKDSNQTNASIRALCGEIDFNLHEVDKFIGRRYRVVNNVIMADGKDGVKFRYITCMTSLFESGDVQQTLQFVPEDIKKRLFDIYHSFREINDRADALKIAFRPWRVNHYIQAVEEFNSLRSDIEELQKSLLALKL